jgi:predicted house-cleaning noncanonical NTP pyrophosphatase (MazG superfamily)
MYAIEFEADVQDGMIKIPSQYKALNSKHIKVIALLDDSEMKKPLEIKLNDENRQFTDEYITEHWRELIMTGLNSYDENYYKSDQYKEDRGNYLMEKYK